ncbi:hypothetical protein HYN56_23910 [Flavobacterium crocinum]|uniref:Lipoprotein n=1 Tax=Flavobacterium crocinum TaxID=2183896 RepID=A0A2S1YSM6_9FLAO|nr:hypothetical protein [Flavobacterium crocinum]AWK07110.1 hypothetical protein HYN56_23910 [Flavobacterium crocinum]
MKYLYVLLLGLSLISCEFKEPIEITQIISKEMVILEDNYKDRSATKDSIRISIPLEFEVNMDSSTRYVVWFYRVDKKTLMDDAFDYEVYNKQDKTKQIFQIDSDLANNKLINIIIKQNNYLISKRDAQKLLKKYNINKSLENLKSHDIIRLTTYDKFRNENKTLINDFNKIPDSIHFKAMRGKKENFYVVKKINW